MFDLRADITQTLRSEIWHWAAFPPSSNSLLLWNSWTKLRLKTSRSEYYLNAFPWKLLQKKCFIVKNFTFINYCWSCGLNKEMWEQIVACYGFCFLVVRVIGTAALSSGSISSHQEVCFREAFFFLQTMNKAPLQKPVYSVCRMYLLLSARRNRMSSAGATKWPAAGQWCDRRGPRVLLVNNTRPHGE